MNKCNLNFADPVIGAEDLTSRLHEKLKELYPETVVDGISSYYAHIRTSEEFFNEFGNWTDPEEYEKIKKLSTYSGILNDQGEPQLHIDSTGPYILTSTGNVYYLDDNLANLTSKDYIEGINTITGEYIDTKNRPEVLTFVENKIKKRIEELKFQEAELQSVLDTIEDPEEQDDFLESIMLNSFKIDKLNKLLSSPLSLNVFVKRIKNRIENQHIKFTETISDKEDNDDLNSHEDIVNFTLDSTEISNRALDDPEILKFFSSIPKFLNFSKSVSDQNKMLNSLFGGPLYMNQAAARSMLESILADIIITNPNQSLFDLYLEALKTEVKLSKHSELNYAYDFLKNLKYNVENPESFKTKFVQAMHKSTQNFAITIVEKLKGKLNIDVIDPALTNNKEGKITNNFIETIINTEGADKLSLSKIQYKANDIFNKEVRGTKDPKVYVKFLRNLLVDQLGLDLHPKTISRLVESELIEGYGNLNNLISTFLVKEVKDSQVSTLTTNELSGQLDVVKELFDSSREYSTEFKNYLMRPKSFLRILGTYESIYTEKNSEASIFAGNKQRWLYSFVSNLQIELQKMKRGVSNRLQQLKDSNLTYVDYMLSNPDMINHIQLITNTELKTENDPNPTLHKQITTADLHLDIFIKMFYSKRSFYADTTARRQGKGAQAEKELLKIKNYLMYNFGADKNSLFALYGLPRPNEGRGDFYNIGNKELGENFKTILRGYVIGEINRSIKDSEVVQEYFEIEDEALQRQHLMDKLIPGYHYSTDKDIEIEKLTAKDFKKGQYYKIGIFTPSFDKYLEDNYEKTFNLKKENNKVAPVILQSFLDSRDGENSQFDKLMSFIYEDVNNIVQQNFEDLNNITIVNNENENGDMVNKKLFDITTNVEFGGNKDLAIYTYILSSFMVGYELSNLFNGHISYYKQKNNENINLDDFLKRGSAPASNGQYPVVDRKDKTKKTYTTYNGEVKTVIANKNTVIAVVNNIETDQSQFADLISKGRGGKRIAYGHEVADAQGFSTAEHFKDVISKIKGWDQNDQEMFDELMDPDHIISLENINWIKKYNKSFTPLKLTHFEIDEKGMPIYLKYSVAPLFPALINGTEAQKIHDQMKKQGVEQLIFKSGSKASNHAPTTIHTSKNGRFTGIKEDLKFNPFVIDTEQLKEQTQVPTKLNNSIAVGNQVIKNILVNIDIESDEKNYQFQGRDLSGKEIYEEIDNTLKNILQLQLNDTLNAFGYDYKEGSFNSVNIKKFLTGQLDIETESDVLQLLQTNLPLETIPNFTQRVFPVISKFIHKNAGKVYTNGGSVVQVANVGFDRVTDKSKSEIFFFDDANRELKPPLPKTYKDLTKEEKLSTIKYKDNEIMYWDVDGNISNDPNKGKMRIAKAKILLPFSGLFSGSELSYNEFVELYKSGQVDEEIVKNIIGYRIPNQAVASIDSFEIVGILPPIAGDQAVVYNEITAKTGSDFDIDKMYLMMPSFTVGKDFAVPEEDAELMEEIEKEMDAKLADVTDFITLNFLKYKNGNQVLRTLMKDKQVEKFILNVAPDAWKGVRKPMGDIVFKYYDEIRNILNTTNSFIMDTDGSRLLLKSILNDTYDAHAKLRNHNNEILKEKNKRLRDIEEKHGYRKAHKFAYLPADNNHINNSKNRLIELYASILESSSTYDDLMSPLDSPVIKETINKVLFEKAKAMGTTNAETLSEFIATQTKSGLEQMFPVSLVNSRVDVLEAKNLISIMANNMTDLGESQKVGFRLKYDYGIGNQELSNIYQLGKEGNNEHKISKIVSYAMNAAVDAAKDDYIISGNFTTYTANAGMMLLRLGMPLEDIFTILTNETILQFSKDKVTARAKTSDIKADLNEQQLDELAETVIGRLANSESIFDIISKEDFLSDNAEKKDLILGYWHLLQEAGKEFNNAVVAMKSDSNGPGKNLAQMISYDNRISQMLVDGVENSDKKWFKNGLTYSNRQFNPDIMSNPNMKFLGAMANNTLFLMKEISSKLFLEASPKVIEAVNTMAAALGHPYVTDESMIKLLYNYLYPFLLYKTKHPLYSMTNTYNVDGHILTEAEWLVQEFPSILQKKRQDTNNYFLQQLIVDTKNKENLIRFLNSENHSVEEKLRFKEALVDLMNEDITFMDNLVKYSYLTTGFKSTPFSFHQFFPANYFINNFHGKYVQNFMDNSDLIDPSEALTLIAMNNHQNYKIVKKKPKAGFLVSNHPIDNAKLLEALEIHNPLGEKAYKPFVRTKRSLYKLIDITEEGPIYNKTSDINDTSTFKLYNYNIETEPLYLPEVYYYSKTAKLFNDSSVTNVESFIEVAGGIMEEIDEIKASSGLTIRELGFSQQDWNNLTEEEKENIITCN